MSKENKPLKAIDADFVSLELDRLELNQKFINHQIKSA